MNLAAYFSNKADDIMAGFEAGSVRRALVKAIKSGNLSQVINIVTPLTVDMRSRIYAKDREEDKPLAGLALELGHTDIFKVLVDRFEDRNGVTKVSTRPDQYTLCVTEKSYLYSAIEAKNKEAAQFLMEGENLDLEEGGSYTRNSTVEWQESPIEAARKAGMIEVTIALADRLGQKRRYTAQALFDEKTREAMAFETEASELRKLNLVEGVYRLPEPYRPNSP